MDFGELLHTAKKNEQSKPQIRYYSTKFSAPKKEQRSKTLSINVQKFLAKKEAEEKQKQREALERKQKLLELRSQDKKATRRVNVMLKRTKSASQAVMADALDCDNTAVTLAGPSQPDEDDYGYVSQEASALYTKMMEKYSKMPEEPKFPLEKKKVSTNLSGTKDRVRAALEKEKEEALLPHRRKRKHLDDGEDTERTLEKSSEKEIELESECVKKDMPKPKFKAAPPVNFSELLKLAEKKQFEPVVIEVKKDDEERPLTKKQKKEMDREREWKERKEAQSKVSQEKGPGLNRIPKINDSVPQINQRIQKKTSVEQSDSKRTHLPKENTSEHISNKSFEKKLNITKSDRSSSKTPTLDGTDKRQSLTKPSLNKKSEILRKSLNGVKSSPSQPTEKSKMNIKQDGPSSKSNPLLQNGKYQGCTARDIQQMKSLNPAKNKQLLPNNVQAKQSPSDKQISINSLKPKQFPPNDIRPKQFPPNDIRPKQFPPNDIRPKQFPPNDIKSKQFPATDVKPKQLLSNGIKPKQFPPNNVKPKQFPPPDVRKSFPPQDVKRKPVINKRRILDDEEYDSEMDDFIDDGPEDGQDYSKYINEIFGYDKNKYRFDDDDVDNMESSFAQQMKEEVISTKIGIMEDLEDMRQEEETKKKKLLMKKRQRL